MSAEGSFLTLLLKTGDKEARELPPSEPLFDGRNKGVYKNEDVVSGRNQKEGQA